MLQREKSAEFRKGDSNFKTLADGHKGGYNKGVMNGPAPTRKVKRDPSQHKPAPCKKH